MDNADTLRTEILKRERLAIKITLLYCLKNKEKLDDLSSHSLDEWVTSIFQWIQVMKLESMFDGDVDGIL